jgi:DDB1- and CUL4-associated factor 11
MHLSPIETAFNMDVVPPSADLHTYGFPPGYFTIKNVATSRLLDVQSDEVEDGTPVILWPETETSLVEGPCTASLIRRVVVLTNYCRPEET